MTRNLLLLLGLAATYALAACSSLPEVKVPERVNVPTPVPCVDPAERPKAPQLRTETDLLAMDQYRRTLAAWQDLQAAGAHLAVLEAIVEGCSRIPARP